MPTPTTPDFREPQAARSEFLTRTAEKLFRLSQRCMDLGVAEQLRDVAAEVQREADQGE